MARQCKTYHCRPAAAFYSMDQTKRYLLENMDKKERCPDSAAFSVFGMAGCQLSYYTAVELSNAGTATVLQYTAPVMILAFEAVKDRRRPDNFEIAALIFALVGTFFSLRTETFSLWPYQRTPLSGG